MNNLNELVTHIFPINIIEEYKKKQLPLGMVFFKICKNFPKSEIGKMKSAQMHYEKNKVDAIIADEVTSKSILKKRSKTHTRMGPYTKFLTQTLLTTCASESIALSDYRSNSFTFEKDSVKYKVTTNDSKSFANKIYIDSNLIFDANNLITFNCLKIIAEKLPVKFDELKLEQANKYVNEVRQKYIELYGNKSETVNHQKLKDLWKNKSPEQSKIVQPVVIKKVA